RKSPRPASVGRKSAAPSAADRCRVGAFLKFRRRLAEHNRIDEKASPHGDNTNQGKSPGDSAGEEAEGAALFRPTLRALV
ncbi:MAG: hypothetical protein WA417_11690, partial [Stellaceae bacterium]